MGDEDSGGGRRSRKDDFEMLGRLGSGSYGVVYKVLRKQDENEYVMKSVRIAELTPAEQDEAINEVKLLASLDFCHVVRYYDSFVEKGTLYIVMEFCNQGDLQRMVRRYKEKGEKSLPEKRIWSIFIQIILGLHYIHQRRVLHRDMKTANVFLSKEPGGKHVVKIGDLGVAKALGTTTAFAHTVVGTPYYLSPELCEDKPYNEKSDVWALGVVLYECCTLDFPFTALNQCALVMKIVKDKPEPIPQGNVSQDLIKMCKRLLNKNPMRRPSLVEILGLRKVQQFMDANNYELPEGIGRVPVVTRAEQRLSTANRRGSLEGEDQEKKTSRDKQSPKRSPHRRSTHTANNREKEDIPRRRVWSEVSENSGNLRGNRVRGRGGQSRVISKKAAAKPIGVARVQAGRSPKKSVLNQSEDEDEDKPIAPEQPIQRENLSSIEVVETKQPSSGRKRNVPSLRDLQQAVEDTTLELEGSVTIKAGQEVDDGTLELEGSATIKAGSRRTSTKGHSLESLSESALNQPPKSGRSYKEADEDEDEEMRPATARSFKEEDSPEANSVTTQSRQLHKEDACHESWPTYDGATPEISARKPMLSARSPSHDRAPAKAGSHSAADYQTPIQEYTFQEEDPLHSGYQSQEGSIEEIPDDDCLDHGGPSPHKLQGTSTLVFQEGGWSGDVSSTQWRVTDSVPEEEVLEYSEEEIDNPEETTLGWSQKLRMKPMTEQADDTDDYAAATIRTDGGWMKGLSLDQYMRTDGDEKLEERSDSEKGISLDEYMLQTEYLHSQDMKLVVEEEEQAKAKREKSRQLQAVRAQQSQMNVLNALNNYQKELAGMVERQRTECIRALGHQSFQDLYDLFSQQKEQSALSFDDEGTDYQQQVLEKCGGDMMSAWEAVYSIQKLLEMETAFREASAQEKPTNSDFEDINAQEIEDEYSDENSIDDEEEEYYENSEGLPRNATIIVSPGKPAYTRDGQIIQHGNVRRSLESHRFTQPIPQSDNSDEDSVKTEKGLDT